MPLRKGTCYMERFFKLKENGTTVSTEIVAGNNDVFYHGLYHSHQSQPAQPVGNGVGRRAISELAAIIGTLVMGLFANVPYAQAPGMGA